ncbi:DNA gyrase subunit A [bacterium]|jgi:DNA gyrase subunit A|nr:DNA gyrase subunit A [bacterium]
MDSSADGKDLNKNIKPVLIENELKTSFLDYAMSVIVSRAIPDVKDGLKPVHRRILYTMHKLGFFYNRPYHKSVRVVGDVLGKFHPHGDTAVYNTMVGMVQVFSKRYPLLDGQGNWGSVDGDSAAAMRYTEVRMKKISDELLADIEKDTVRFVPNFDESTVEPTVLPSKLPQLLINGTAGIAVGMATSIPPHNLTEVINACLALLKNPNISEDELFQIVPAPDFPTGGIICGRAGIVQAYRTGRGRVILRAVVDIEENKKREAIVITELPYQVNKSELIIKIADLVKNKVVEGISNIRDESDKRGMRVVIELKRGEMPQVILNLLYKHTNLQTSFSILMLALLDNKPMVFTLKELLTEFLSHRKDVIYKRTEFDLKKAKNREHILEGFIVALQNIDEVIKLIKQSQAAEEAIKLLNKRFLISQDQGKAILEMRLQRLTGMEQEKIRQEMDEIKKTISRLKSILDDFSILKNEIVTELEETLRKYGDARASRIEGAIDAFTEADLIPEESVVVTLTRKGYIKRVSLSTYGVQHRGGKGKMGMASLQESDDIVSDLFVANSHDELLFFTNFGRVYNVRVFEIPEGSRISKGRAIVNLLPLQDGEHVVKLLCTKDMEKQSLVMITKKGVIKRTDAQSFAKIRSTGIRALSLREGDELVFCSLSTGDDSIVVATLYGQGIRFSEKEVRQMGRQAAGVRAIRLKTDDVVVGMEVVSDEDCDVLFATERGYGKRVKVRNFRVAHRGGVGVRTIPTGKRNGNVIGLARISDTSHILLIDINGKIIRLDPSEVRTMGRHAQGVRLIRLEKAQKLIGVVAFDDEDLNDPDDSENLGQEKNIPKAVDKTTEPIGESAEDKTETKKASDESENGESIVEEEKSSAEEAEKQEGLINLSIGVASEDEEEEDEQDEEELDSGIA